MQAGSNLVTELRTSNRVYLRFVHRWWMQLLTRVRPLMIHNGGHVLMVQLESEYWRVWKEVGGDDAYLTVYCPFSQLITCLSE